MRRLIVLLIAVSGLLASWTPLRAEVAVVASIKPIHSLVAGVMQGAGEPLLIVEGGGSPHSQSLKPSQARALEQAQLVFWVGADLEPFLEKPIRSLAGDAAIVTLLDTPGLTTLPVRDGGAFDHHEHEAEEHEAEHEHEAEEEHGDEHEHEHGAVNPHIWLDPDNAKILVEQIATALVAADPDNAALYRANAAASAARLERLAAEMDETLAPVRDRPFVVFHDAYQNLEHRFGLHAVGAITVNPDVLPGAERVAEIKARLRELDAACVFAEPQFEPKLVPVVVEGTSARPGVLDPLGASIDQGPDLYFKLMGDLAAAIRACLSPSD